jgi:hypothetical protein
MTPLYDARELRAHGFEPRRLQHPDGDPAAEVVILNAAHAEYGVWTSRAGPGVESDSSSTVAGCGQPSGGRRGHRLPRCGSPEPRTGGVTARRPFLPGGVPGGGRLRVGDRGFPGEGLAQPVSCRFLWTRGMSRVRLGHLPSGILAMSHYGRDPDSHNQ